MDMENNNGNSLGAYICNLSRSLQSAITEITGTSSDSTFSPEPQSNINTPQIVLNGVEIETSASTKWDITEKDLRADIAQLKRSRVLHTGLLIHSFEVCLQVAVWLKTLAEEQESVKHDTDKMAMIKRWLQNVELVKISEGSQVLDWKKGLGNYEPGGHHMEDLATMAMERLQLF